jgi:hypothetical protein
VASCGFKEDIQLSVHVHQEDHDGAHLLAFVFAGPSPEHLSMLPSVTADRKTSKTDLLCAEISRASGL